MTIDGKRLRRDARAQGISFPLKRGPGRPEAYSEAQVIAALRRSRGLLTGAARLLRCSLVTVSRYVRTYPAVAAARAEEREALIDTAELKLAQAVRKGEAWAICFTLKCLGKGRGYVERTEHAVAAAPFLSPEVQAQLDALTKAIQQADEKTIMLLYDQELAARRREAPGGGGEGEGSMNVDGGLGEG